MKKTTFKFKNGNELLSSHSGLVLTGLLLGRTNLANQIADAHLLSTLNPKISNEDVIQSMIGLLTLGKTHYDDIEPFRESSFLEQSGNIQTRQAKQVIELYHQHGESEQFHSEYKTDLDMERLPSGKFTTNALIMLLGMMAFNIIRICGQGSLIAISELKQMNEPLSHYRKSGVFRRRIRSVLLDIMYLASHVTSSSRYTWMSFGRCCLLSGVFKWLYHRFSTPVLAPNG